MKKDLSPKIITLAKFKLAKMDKFNLNQVILIIQNFYLTCKMNPKMKFKMILEVSKKIKINKFKFKLILYKSLIS